MYWYIFIFDETISKNKVYSFLLQKINQTFVGRLEWICLWYSLNTYYSERCVLWLWRLYFLLAKLAMYEALFLYSFVFPVIGLFIPHLRCMSPDQPDQYQTLGLQCGFISVPAFHWTMFSFMLWLKLLLFNAFLIFKQYFNSHRC
jgi:hypothetical protein